MKMGCTLILAALMIPLCAHKAEAGEFEGAGLRLCSEYLSDSKKFSPSEEDFYFSWAEGFMSGVNVARLNDEAGAFKSMPADQQKTHIRDFCSKNPTEKFYKAVFDLYVTLYPKKDAGGPGLGGVELDKK
jgi:hypothetical protein